MKIEMKNFKFWLTLRFIDYIALFIVIFIYSYNRDSGVLESSKIAFIQTNLIVLLLYIYLGYIFFSFFIFILSSYFEKNIIISLINFLTPFYILGAIVIVGTIPKVDSSYLYNNIIPLSMILLSSGMHLLIYREFYIHKIEDKST